jgi:hypothetical protein
MGRLLGFIALGLLTSCASPPAAPVFLTDRAAFALLPPSAIERPLDMPQQISGAYRDQQFIMDAWVSADETQMSMFLFNSLGAEIARLSFDGKNAAFESSYFPKNLRAEYIAADFQMVFYKPEALARALGKAGLRFESSGNGQNEMRTVWNGKQKIINIEKKPDEIRYENYLRRYSYILRGDFVENRND